MRLLVDVVPNHMAAHRANSWWWDVLESGRSSRYAPVFDIDWESQDQRVLLPILSRPLAELYGTAGVLEGDGGPLLELDGQLLPLARGVFGPDMVSLIANQHYRPAYWRLSVDEGNYRRFFDIDGLIGVRLEDPSVFERTQRFTIELCSDERVAGVRVDHIDGLADPAAYLRRLVGELAAARTDAVVVVEKILSRDESLRASWAVDGTTGYEFARVAGGLFVDDRGRPSPRRARSRAHRRPRGLRTALRTGEGRSARFVVLRLARAPGPSGDGGSRPGAAWPRPECACGPRGARHDDRRARGVPDISGRGATRTSRPRKARASRPTQLREPGGRPGSQAHNHVPARGGSSFAAWREVARRWQQLSGAVMAKGVEDTATYRYSGLLAQAEVGCNPGEPSATPAELSRLVRSRRGWRASMNTTSTHDSKRNEDARARLVALSEAASQWAALVHAWHRRHISTGPVHPTRMTSWSSIRPLPPYGRSVPRQLGAGDRRRARAYVLKAAREAKTRTSWTDPDHEYEAALRSFVLRLTRELDFSGEMSRLVGLIGPAAATNSLAMTVLKAIAPGVPDIYQGTEFFEASLTDPDNRRPVDFAKRQRALGDLPPSDAPHGTLAPAAMRLLENWHDGHIKLFVLRALLHLRRRDPELFAAGSFRLLEANGPGSEHVVAFSRRLGRRLVVAVVPRLTLSLSGPARFPLAAAHLGRHGRDRARPGTKRAHRRLHASSCPAGARPAVAERRPVATAGLGPLRSIRPGILRRQPGRRRPSGSPHVSAVIDGLTTPVNNSQRVVPLSRSQSPSWPAEND